MNSDRMNSDRMNSDRMNSDRMNSDRMNSDRMESEVLNSWKEIAAYLGRGVRTVQRWERELGLPVRRPRGKERSAVIALKSDLDHWLQHTPQHVIASQAHSAAAGAHLQLRKETELLRARTIQLVEQCERLRSRLEQNVILASALQRKKKAAAAGVGTAGLAEDHTSRKLFAS